MGATESSLQNDGADRDQIQEDRQGKPRQKNGNKSLDDRGHSNARNSKSVELRLHGSVLGSRGTGKSSLLCRLKGGNPFNKIDRNEIENLESVSIPWKGPEKGTEARIILYDGIIADDDLDFVLIMVDPRRSQTLSDAAEIAENLLAKTNQNPLKNVCICIMQNFKDLPVENQINADTKKTSTAFSSLQSTVDKLNSLHNEVNSVHCFETSMVDCYGLLPLHNFIRIPFYCRQEYLIRSQLKDIIADKVECTKHFSELLKRQNYVKFSKSASSAVGRLHVRVPSKQATNNSTPTDGNPKPKVRDSKAYVKLTDYKKSPPGISIKPAYDPNQSLESFFADSDDEISYVAKENATKPAHENESMSSYSSDEGDDDIFYDIEGRRQKVSGTTFKKKLAVQKEGSLTRLEGKSSSNAKSNLEAIEDSEIRDHKVKTKSPNEIPEGLNQTVSCTTIDSEHDNNSNDIEVPTHDGFNSETDSFSLDKSFPKSSSKCNLGHFADEKEIEDELCPDDKDMLRQNTKLKPNRSITADPEATQEEKNSITSIDSDENQFTKTDQPKKKWAKNNLRLRDENRPQKNYEVPQESCVQELKVVESKGNHETEDDDDDFFIDECPGIIVEDGPDQCFDEIRDEFKTNDKSNKLSGADIKQKSSQSQAVLAAIAATKEAMLKEYNSNNNIENSEGLKKAKNMKKEQRKSTDKKKKKKKERKTDDEANVTKDKREKKKKKKSD